MAGCPEIKPFDQATFSQISAKMELPEEVVHLAEKELRWLISAFRKEIPHVPVRFGGMGQRGLNPVPDPKALKLSLQALTLVEEYIRSSGDK